MIRRIVLTLGMGVAVMTAGSGSIAPSRTAVEATPSLLLVAGVKPTGHATPRGTHRSGYIVASS
jgi:hypothetical protein